MSAAQASLAPKPAPCSEQAAALPAASGPLRPGGAGRQPEERGLGGRAGLLGPGRAANAICWLYISRPRPAGQPPGTSGHTSPSSCCGKLAGCEIMGELTVGSKKQKTKVHYCVLMYRITQELLHLPWEKKLKREGFSLQLKGSLYVLCIHIQHRSTHGMQITRNFLCWETVLLKSESVLAAGIAAAVGCSSCTPVRAVGGAVWVAGCA